MADRPTQLESRLDRALARKVVGDPEAEEQRNTAMAVAVQQAECRCATCLYLRALEDTFDD